ncbi:phage tail protein [Sulfurimonas sp. ST-25]|uniref:phage tail protein n=1 Tax=Sulfurimonas sp. ST-25 TaxID=3400151 RepID=UPI003A84141A
MAKADFSGAYRGLDKLIKALTTVERKDVPYITMTATNNLAFDAMGSIRDEIKGNLNVKKKQIPNALRVKKATKSKPYALLYADEWSWQYRVLVHHFVGGDRERKGMEKAMIYLGLMHRNEILTPSPGVTIRPSAYVQMMSQIKLFYKAGFNANETQASRAKGGRKTRARYFVITGRSKSPLAPGVYARMPGHDKPICMLRISEKPTYRKRLDMEVTVRKVYARMGRKHLSDAVARAAAIRNAKGW